MKYPTDRDLGHLLLGIIIGSILTFALSGHAQCCAQFDVPFNTQLEQEHWQTLRDAERSVEDYIDLPYGNALYPCRR